MAIHILGITGYRQDSAAALLRDGEIVAAALEASFSRRSGDGAFPAAAIDYCLREVQLAPGAIDLVVFCDLLQSGGGLRSLITALRRTQLQVMLRRELAALIGSGLHALPPLALISRSQAAVELAAFPDLSLEQPDGYAAWGGDAACAIGAALQGWHEQLGKARRMAVLPSCLGPWFGSDGICAWLDESGISYRRFDTASLIEAVAQQLGEMATVGWFQGRLEFGERSCGARAILSAPAVKLLRKLQAAHGEQILLLTLDRKLARDWLAQPAQSALQTLLAKRSDAVVWQEIDGVAHPRLQKLLACVASRGIPLLFGFDFRAGDEPLVATPVDAYRCFMRSDMEALVLEEMLLLKQQQPLWEEAEPS